MNTDSSSMEMNPEIAKRLFNEGAVLIIAGIPIGTEFGIDLCTYTIGERFRGVKMIPTGPHYVYCASQGLYGDSAPRVGFIHYFKPYEILIREWNPNTEELRSRQISNPELEKKRIRENLKDLDQFLAPYDYRFIPNWRSLTDSITEDGVKNCSPECGVIRTNVELLSCPDSERPRGSSSSRTLSKMSARLVLDENELLPNLKPIPGSIPSFVELPSRIPKEATPSEISKHSLDCVTAVDKLVSLFPKFNLLIEEIQLAFVCFLTGYSLESLAHWRKILNLLCNSELAINKHRLLYMKYLEVLQHQLPLLPEELMEQNEKNTVCRDVKNVLLNATLSGLSVSAEKLNRSLKKSMKWNFENLLDEDPDDMPVIVDLE